MSKLFDGLSIGELTEVSFGSLHLFARFFNCVGEGYTKHGRYECVDDYSLMNIRCDPDNIVLVEKRV
jgi:hypothetical protein